MDKIVREFKVLREDREMIYPFTTYSCVLDSPPSDNRLREKVFTYLRSVFLSGCPSLDGKVSVTERPPLMVKIERRKSDLTELALKSDYRLRGSFQHAFVQKYFLENDPYTIATEVPVWDEKLSGHIDLLRLFPGKIQVPDFKPEAHKEKKAGSQVYNYIILLSKALRLPLSCFEGVYFDDRNAYFLTF